jgi:pimeloyl-ACP methyl ester carboxylesterase
MKNATLILFTLITTISLFAQDITGQWDGILKLPGGQLTIVFNINKTENGYTSTMDSPDQGAKGISVASTKFENQKITLTASVIGVEYQGTLENNTIVGNFIQGGHSLPLNLTKSTGEKKIEKPTDNSIVETAITLKTNTGDIYGTLTTPKKFKTTSVALIIAGSGPTDRNGNGDAYKQLAKSLAHNNIASLRFDKRGVAESMAAIKNESDLRFEDYINDAKDWIQLLKQDKRFTELVVIGHSEGSLIGMIASTSADKFISIAGPGQSIDKILKIQLSTEPKEVKELEFTILDSLAKVKMVENIDSKLDFLFRKSIQPYMISWIKYNPQIEIQKLTIPTLIIQGTKDIQVSVEEANLLSKGKPNAKLVLIDKMNHPLKTVEGDLEENMATYNNPDLPINKELVKVISNFILKNK